MRAHCGGHTTPPHPPPPPHSPLRASAVVGAYFFGAALLAAASVAAASVVAAALVAAGFSPGASAPFSTGADCEQPMTAVAGAVRRSKRLCRVSCHASRCQAANLKHPNRGPLWIAFSLSLGMASLDMASTRNGYGLVIPNNACANIVGINTDGWMDACMHGALQATVSDIVSHHLDGGSPASPRRGSRKGRRRCQAGPPKRCWLELEA